MKEKSFETAFERLEEILQEMNDEKVSLDNSLKLFEEANLLIAQCNKRLNQAEQKIEILTKNRNDLVIEKEKPKTEDFSSNENKI